MDNYCPISLLPAISKVFQKVFFNQLCTYFTSNNLFYKGKYGFREDHSTETVNIELVDRIITALDDKSRNRFVQIKILWNILDWINNYLTNRTQYVALDHNISSSRKYITKGVTQGSILGPLLFLIYMNDLSNTSEVFAFTSFADDTDLFSAIEYSITITKINLNETLNSELFRSTWLVDAKQAHVEYNEDQMHGLLSYSKRYKRIDTNPRNVWHRNWTCLRV